MIVTYQSVKIRLLDDDIFENLHVFTSSQNFALESFTWKKFKQRATQFS